MTVTTPTTARAPRYARAEASKAPQIDLDAYLTRIGYTGSLAPTVASLHDLAHGHVTGIPFENLDILLGRPVSLEPTDVADKLVRRHRGGYCFEHCVLFATVLEQAGFPVTPLLSRVHPNADDPSRAVRTHMTLLVRAEGEDWLADVGFGASMPAPIPLTGDATARHGGWEHRLDESDGYWTLSERRQDGPVPLHRFTLDPVTRADLDVAHHYTATHPRSPFTRQSVVFRTKPTVRHRLHGSRLTTSDGRTDDEREIGADDLPDVLRDLFGLDLPEQDLAAVQQVCKQEKP